ncbi:MAG: DNA (cytosine-5-)-methyltransferase [Alistipes sp.]|nr:DNA (cytosine-5-)-methyltransferase [Alistipes sp.]
MLVMTNKEYTFIDLFAGLGGFHLALQQLGCKCVFASELKEDLRKLYQLNFPELDEEYLKGDITMVDVNDIPSHDILCGGFPCQPFSQAGKRLGFQDEGRGDLFFKICEIIQHHRPRYIFLENVANLKGHDNGDTWRVIKRELEKLDYYVPEPEILSPHQFGIPQHRRRIYIVGLRKDLIDSKDPKPFEFPNEKKEKNCDITTIIDSSDTDIQPLALKTLQQLKVWQKFLTELKKRNRAIPRFPIWAMEFDADYDYEDIAPFKQTKKQLKGHKGKLGWEINGPSKEDCLRQLPIYAQTDTADKFPEWKIRYIRQNREFWTENADWLSSWIEYIKDWDNSHQKLEWNCRGNNDGDLKHKIIQFRASGIRVKLPTFSPALNLVGTQVPILPWIELPKECIPIYSDEELDQYGLTQDDIRFGRYLSTKEAAALQGMGKLKFGHLSRTRIYEALGNAVNVDIVTIIAKKLLGYEQ